MRFNKIFTINPPSPTGYVSNKDSMGGFGQLYPLGATLFPPLDLIYLTSYLAEKQLPVIPIECLALGLNKEELIERISSSCTPNGDDSVLIFVRTSAPTLDWDLKVCSEIKTAMPGIKLGIYGPVVTQVIERIQKEDFLDYIIKGDPDEIVHALVIGYPEEEIPGLTLRREGKWVSNADRPFFRDLDKLPFPKWDMFPYKQYRLPKSSTSAEMSFLPVWSSRGCPIGCEYCPYPVGQGLPWRYRSALNVVDEIEHLVKDLGIQYILFRDPMFSLNQKRVLKICEEIERRAIKVKWRCETRVDFLNEETLRAMASAGCDGINFGVESTDIEIQENVGRKPITQEQFIKCFDLCRELGIKTFAFFIIGLPGDTLETILKTIKFAIDIRPNWVQFTAASPFIGTKLRDWAITQGLVADDEFAYINSHEVMMGNENLSKEQVQSLYHFAQFVQGYLLNRRGILKDDNRPSLAYRAAKSMADSVSDGVAHILFMFARLWFQSNFVRAH